MLTSIAGMSVLECVFDVLVCEQRCRAEGIAMEGAEFLKVVQEELDRVRKEAGEKGEGAAAEASLVGMLTTPERADRASPLVLRTAARLRLLAKKKDLQGQSEVAWAKRQLRFYRAAANIRVDDQKMAQRYKLLIESIQTPATRPISGVYGSATRP